MRTDRCPSCGRYPRRCRCVEHAASFGMTPTELSQLAVYNTERSRGIAHTPDWDRRMAVLQARFDAGTRRAAAASGRVILG